MGKTSKHVSDPWLGTRRAFSLGILATLLVASVALVYDRATADDGLRYLYVIRLDPASDGPMILSLDLPVLEEGLWRVVDVNGVVMYFGGGTMFAVRSAERKDPNEIRREIDRPDLGTRRADAGGKAEEPSA